MEEGIDLVHRLWTEENVTFDGRFTQVRDMTIYPRPVQKPCPPIWVGCRTEKSVARAARMGFHLMTTLGLDPAPSYRAALAREGRNPATGGTIKIAASKRLAFAPAKAVKDALNG